MIIPGNINVSLRFPWLRSSLGIYMLYIIDGSRDFEHHSTCIFELQIANKHPWLQNRWHTSVGFVVRRVQRCFLFSVRNLSTFMATWWSDSPSRFPCFFDINVPIKIASVRVKHMILEWKLCSTSFMLLWKMDESLPYTYIYIYIYHNLPKINKSRQRCFLQLCT